MEIETWYGKNYEGQLQGRYITLKKILPILERYKNRWEISTAGFSEKGKSIPMIKIGSGKKIVLAWSQMHGNESTTTKAIFDFIKFLNQKDAFQKEVQLFLVSHTLYIIPILNPDGAEAYTRENSNGVDLNRDAQELSQSESKCLQRIFDQIRPGLCLNLHDQRTIYGFENGKPATLSFLSPAADMDRSITEVRKKSMELIVQMHRHLEKMIPGQIGRYDDSFNLACVGDTFQFLGVPTILFEAGHYPNDYQREKTRELVFHSFLALFSLVSEKRKADHEDYFNIPENRKNYRDLIIRNIKLDHLLEPTDIAIQLSEELRDGKVVFVPVVNQIGGLENFYGHLEKDIRKNKTLTKSNKNLTVGVKLSEIDCFWDKI